MMRFKQMKHVVNKAVCLTLLVSAAAQRIASEVGTLDFRDNSI